MINVFKTSFDIDFCCAINSFIYTLKKTPILKNIINDDIYSKNGFKKFSKILGLICTMFKLLVSRASYFLIIFIICNILKLNSSRLFIHTIFVCSLIGMFLNTSILNTSRKKYISIILFKMDPRKFIISHYIYDCIINFIFNTLLLTIFFIILKIPIFLSFIISLFFIFSKTIGEELNIKYYKTNNMRITDDKILFILVLVIGIILLLLPIVNIYFNTNIIILLTIISFIFSIFSYIYINNVNNYKSLYKKINNYNMAVNSKYQSDYNVQAYTDIKNRDKKIDDKKLANKSGYQLFNTIFFLRHKTILSRSANINMILITVIFLITVFSIYQVPNIKVPINNFLMNNLGWFVLIMYFINRGSNITKAMYFNCDHAMLTFNFYREKNVILGLFKKRLLTIIKVNMGPALLLGVFLQVIIFLTGGANYLYDYVNIFIYILSLSVFFSVHYMVIYYLMQPYNSDMKVVNNMYNIVLFLTYFIAYQATKLNLSSTVFSIAVIIFTFIYVNIALILVYKKAPKTFKLK